jgi:hypothetical protein
MSVKMKTSCDAIVPLKDMSVYNRDREREREGERVRI